MPIGTFYGQVTDAETGEPIPEATVELTFPTGHSTTILTPNAEYIMYVLPGDGYTLICKAPSYQTWTKRNLSVGEQQYVQVDVEMVPLPTPPGPPEPPNLLGVIKHLTCIAPSNNRETEDVILWIEDGITKKQYNLTFKKGETHNIGDIYSFGKDGFQARLVPRLEFYNKGIMTCTIDNKYQPNLTYGTFQTGFGSHYKLYYCVIAKWEIKHYIKTGKKLTTRTRAIAKTPRTQKPQISTRGKILPKYARTTGKTAKTKSIAQTTTRISIPPHTIRRPPNKTTLTRPTAIKPRTTIRPKGKPQRPNRPTPEQIRKYLKNRNK